MEHQKDNIREINKRYRAADESHLWPICNKFNATERAIRNVRKLCAAIGPCDDYAAELDAELTRIVNNEKNW